jgi:hypothetical protein
MFKKLCLLLMLVLTLGACSKSTPAASGTDSPTDTPTTEPTTDGGDVAEFCALGDATFGAGNPFQGFDQSSPETLREGFEAAVKAFTDLFEAAPADVRVTIEDGVNAMVEIEASLDAVDYDFSRLTAEDTQRFTTLADAFDFEAFAAAAAGHCS